MLTSHAHLSNKLVEAAPGSPIGFMIHWVLNNPLVAEWSVYLMSATEMAVGAGLIFGILTRLSALGAALVNVALMLIFGWQGFECLDEWTMAALGFAISTSVMIYGTGAYSVDSWRHRDDFAKLFTKKVSVVLTVLSVAMTFGFYSYFFGFFHFHKLTNTANYHISALPMTGQADTARIYVDAGPSAKGAYIKSMTFTLADGSKVVQPATKIEVIKSHFEPWSHSGKVVDGLLKVRLGGMLDIRIPQKAQSAVIALVDNKDPVVTFQR